MQIPPSEVDQGPDGMSGLWATGELRGGQDFGLFILTTVGNSAGPTWHFRAAKKI